jgi:hypothetical protein
LRGFLPESHGSRVVRSPPLVWQESSDSRTIATRGFWDARSVSAFFRQQHAEPSFAPSAAGVSIVLDTPRCDVRARSRS